MAKTRKMLSDWEPPLFCSLTGVYKNTKDGAPAGVGRGPPPTL